MLVETAIREVAKDVWTFSRPFTRYGLFPIGGRSTAIKLASQDGVWVLASSPLDSETKGTIDKLGPVKFIVGGNAVHYLYLGEFQKAYPEAKLIAPLDATLKADKALRFDGVWGKDPVDTKYGFEDDIQHCYFSGFRNKDVAFFHPASKTMIQADLLFNLPATEQYSKSKASANLSYLGSKFSQGYSSPFQNILVSVLGQDKGVMSKDAKTVMGWDFERIIPCHGDVIEKDGKKAWQEAFHACL